MVLKTPDVIRRLNISEQIESFSDSPRKPSILKQSNPDDSESDRMSDCSKLKVTFSLTKSRKINKSGDFLKTTANDFISDDDSSQIPISLDEDADDISKIDEGSNFSLDASKSR